MKNAIPLWVVASLGEEVALKEEFIGTCKVYPPGSRGIVTSIHLTGDGLPYVTVMALDPEDPLYWENFNVEQIRPVAEAVTFTVNLEQGLLMPAP